VFSKWAEQPQIRSTSRPGLSLIGSSPLSTPLSVTDFDSWVAAVAGGSQLQTALGKRHRATVAEAESRPVGQSAAAPCAHVQRPVGLGHDMQAESRFSTSWPRSSRHCVRKGSNLLGGQTWHIKPGNSKHAHRIDKVILFNWHPMIQFQYISDCNSRNCMNL
jgi:hypothetical protein